MPAKPPSAIVMPAELSGTEVILRPLSPDDAAALALAAAESREHYGFNPVPEGLAGAHAYIVKALAARAEGRRLPFAILWRGRVVGSTSYAEFQPWEWPAGSGRQRVARPDAVEVGYTWLAASAQRTRCNTEAKFLLLKHAFEGWDVYRVSLRTDERNARSRRAIERLGARFEGIRRADKPGEDGTVRHSAFYSIVQAEWPEVRQRLEGILVAGAERSGG
ncbi:MAG: GNAT family N-acetyltransferase [Opitutales bacterium]